MRTDLRTSSAPLRCKLSEIPVSSRCASKRADRVGSPGDFAKLGKQGILEKVEEKGGPEVRRLFEKCMRDIEKLQAQQEQKDG
jgi:GTPase SAR1 family protein